MTSSSRAHVHARERAKVLIYIGRRGQVALTIGSSGLGSNRFLEIMQQGTSASATLALKSGIHIEFSSC